MIEDHLGQLDQQMADLLAAHHDAVQRLAEVPGLGVDSAQQIIAEVGVTAATFPSPKHLASWMGACPGNEESAGINYSHRCPKGNRQMRRVLNQAANAAVKAKGTIFAIAYRRLVPRLGHAQAIGAIAHRLCRLIWKILHQGIPYEERGPAVGAEGGEGAGAQDDPRTAKSRLPRGTDRSSIGQPGMMGSDFRPWLISAA
ncbi:MAG: transposase [Vicinamibacterales bacterium]